MTAAHILLWVRMCGCGGGAMMGVRRGWGRGLGRGFYRSFEQNRYRYIQFGYRYASYETKSAEITGNPHFWGVSSLNDIIISQKHHVLAPKKSKNEMCERFQLIIYARRSHHLRKLKNWLTSNFYTQIFQYSAMISSQKWKYQQISV